MFLFPGVCVFFFFLKKKRFCLCLRSGFLCVSVRSVSWVKSYVDECVFCGQLNLSHRWSHNQVTMRQA